ncbi:hypothetical protein FPV16_18655 [Methylobacterium sp. W2]|uniref:DUF6925 family protein n=1 Tax=Methylobacterium sp. W2 TaxID=2598107 RepID=UPI001D0C14A6|nr:hypothetical protein [Methylobacterium sp. W2]MCC0808206.1 hypothetical protein [Methylobacterium sp. W2]
MEHEAVASLLASALDDPFTTWSLGSFGAVASFLRDPEEVAMPVADARMGLVTARGAIALDSAALLRPVAFETGFAFGWNHALALCLPRDACAMGRRSVVTELGPDREAAGIAHRDHILFDLGLNLLAVDACVRTGDPVLIDLLRSRAGRGIVNPDKTIAAELVAAGPHRVFVTRIGRIEVFSPIRIEAGSAPVGPRTHILPQILRLGRTHAATAPIPAGWVPCGTIHPPHPCRDVAGGRISFQRDRHEAFQALLARWGDPDLIAAKHAAIRGEAVSGRHARSARRAAEAQEACLRGEG